MTIEMRAATQDDWEQMCLVDGRNFGFSYTEPERAEALTLKDLSRFFLALDGKEIVGVVGSYSLDMTVPGGTSVPMSGVTWVSCSPTHRRQGIITRLMALSHADAIDRGEPVAALWASEGAIYERFGYGAAMMRRRVEIDTSRARIRPTLRPDPGSARFMTHDEAESAVPELWERFRRVRAGEVTRSIAWHDRMLLAWRKPDGAMSEGFFLRHADGYAAYRVTPRWTDGAPVHELHLQEFAAITPEAHLALWDVLLNIDLVGSIHGRFVAIDDPLNLLCTDHRSVQTVGLIDGVWVNPLDVGVAFGARTYATTDKLVVEADGRRWAIDGGPDAATCRPVRTRPDLTTSIGGLGALLLGGVRPSQLVAGRALEARNADVLRRADLFFPTSLAPNCQTMF